MWWGIGKADAFPANAIHPPENELLWSRGESWGKSYNCGDVFPLLPNIRSVAWLVWTYQDLPLKYTTAVHTRIADKPLGSAWVIRCIHKLRARCTLHGGRDVLTAKPCWIGSSWPWGFSLSWPAQTGFCECGFVLSPPGAALTCLGSTELTASSHKCPWAESDLQTKPLWRVGIPEKGSSLCFEFLLSGVYFWTDYKHWRQLLPHLKIALEEGLTVPWPAANSNCYS